MSASRQTRNLRHLTPSSTPASSYHSKAVSLVGRSARTGDDAMQVPRVEDHGPVGAGVHQPAPARQLIAAQPLIRHERRPTRAYHTSSEEKSHIERTKITHRAMRKRSPHSAIAPIRARLRLSPLLTYRHARAPARPRPRGAARRRAPRPRCRSAAGVRCCGAGSGPTTRRGWPWPRRGRAHMRDATGQPPPPR